MNERLSQPGMVLDGGAKDAAPPLSQSPGSADAGPQANWLTKVALIAAMLCLLVGGFMLYQHARATERDPWKSPQLLALKDALRAAPTDEAIKAEIRRLDLEFRQRYVRRLALNRTGGWLLVGGLAVVLATANRAAKLRAKPWQPKLRGNLESLQRAGASRARWAVAGVGLVFTASLLVMGLTAQSPLPDSAAELAKFLAPPPGKEVGDAPALAEFQANTPRFRGWDGGGHAGGGFNFSFLRATNAGVIWKTPVPAAGFNSPVAWSERVFLSGGDAEKREVFCFDAGQGALLWRRAVENIPGSPAEQPEVPEMTGFAAPTMATDGRRAYVMFANGDLAAFNFDGSTAWSKHLGVPKNMYGHAASLAVWPGRLAVQLDQDEGAPGGSKLLAFDAATGRQVWERSKPTHGSWSSPIIIEAAGRMQIITLGLPWVMSHALTDGIELWRADLMSGEIAPSPVYAGGLVLVVSPSGGVSALRPDGAGDISKSHVVWTADEVIPDITSPVSDGQLAFVVSTPGELACLDAATGKILWQHELGVEVQASPALAGGELLVLGTKGDLMVVAAAREFREVTRVKLEDEFYASPAMAGGRMFLRGVTNLWGLGNSTKAGDER